MIRILLVLIAVLTGHRDPGVRIIGIGVEKVQIEPVLAGTSIQLNSAGEAPSIELAANLDETRPKILSNGAPYIPGRNITLKNGKQENLKVSLTTSAKLYQWTIVIDYVDEAGAAHKVFVNRLGHTFPDPSGSPLGELFTLTGAAPTYGSPHLLDDRVLRRPLDLSRPGPPAGAARVARAPSSRRCWASSGGWSTAKSQPSTSNQNASRSSPTPSR